MHLKIRCLVSLMPQLKYSLTKVQNFMTNFNNYVRNHPYMILTLFHKTIVRQMGQLNGWCTSLAWALTVFSPYHHEALQQGFFTLQQISLDLTGLDWTGLGWVGFVWRWGEGVRNHFTCFSELEYQRNFFCLVVQLVCKALREISWCISREPYIPEHERGGVLCL